MAKKTRGEVPPDRRRLLVPILGVSLVAILAVAVLVAISRPSPATPPPATFEPPPFASGTAKGKASAPVTIIEYSDFQ